MYQPRQARLSGVVTAASGQEFVGGTGGPDDPYQIAALATETQRSIAATFI